MLNAIYNFGSELTDLWMNLLYATYNLQWVIRVCVN